MPRSGRRTGRSGGSSGSTRLRSGREPRHRMAAAHRHPKSNFARLARQLERCMAGSTALTRREVGWVRRALANTITRHGEPGSDTRRRAAGRAGGGRGPADARRRWPRVVAAGWTGTPATAASVARPGRRRGRPRTKVGRRTGRRTDPAAPGREGGAGAGGAGRRAGGARVIASGEVLAARAAADHLAAAGREHRADRAAGRCTRRRTPRSGAAAACCCSTWSTRSGSTSCRGSPRSAPFRARPAAVPPSPRAVAA